MAETLLTQTDDFETGIGYNIETDFQEPNEIVRLGDGRLLGHFITSDHTPVELADIWDTAPVLESSSDSPLTKLGKLASRATWN